MSPGLLFLRCRVLFQLSLVLLLPFLKPNLATKSGGVDFATFPRREEAGHGEATACSAVSDDWCVVAASHSDSPSLSDSNEAATTTKFFTAEQHEAFDRNGFLIVSDMLDPPMLQELVAASDSFLDQTEKVDAYFSSIEMGMIFQAGDHVNQTITRAFRKVALESVFPSAAAELMRLEPTESVRVLRYATSLSAHGTRLENISPVSYMLFLPNTFAVTFSCPKTSILTKLAIGMLMM